MASETGGMLAHDAPEATHAPAATLPVSSVANNFRSSNTHDDLLMSSWER